MKIEEARVRVVRGRHPTPEEMRRLERGKGCGLTADDLVVVTILTYGLADVNKVVQETKSLAEESGVRVGEKVKPLFPHSEGSHSCWVRRYGDGSSVIFLTHQLARRKAA